MKTGKKGQFVMIPNRVIFDPCLSSIDVRVYGCLRAHRTEKKKNSVFPSKSTLAKMLDCSVATIERAIKRLVQQGHLSYEKGFTGRSNTYQFKEYSLTGHTLKNEGVAASALQADTSNYDVAIPAKMMHQPESFNHNHKPERGTPLFYGRDRAYLEPNGSVTLKSPSGERTQWSGYKSEDFAFGTLRGEEALKAARRRYACPSDPNGGNSGTLPLLPTSEEDFGSSRPTSPLFNNSNG